MLENDKKKDYVTDLYINYVIPFILILECTFSTYKKICY